MTSAIVDRDWRVLLDSLERANCVVLLGPDLAVGSSDGERQNLEIGLSRHLATILADEERVTVQDPDNLPLVSQVFIDRKTRTDLEVEVISYYERVDGKVIHPGSGAQPFEDLAALPLQLIVSSRHDRTLRRHLEAQGKRPVEKAYEFKGSQLRTIGRLGTIEAPLIYRLFGSLGDPTSLAVTEADHLSLLEAIISGNPAIPTDLQNDFREKSFLFLGCGLHRYRLRVLVHALGFPQSRQRSFALEAITGAEEELDPWGTRRESVWFYEVGYRTLKFLDMDEGEFLRELRERCEKRGCRPVRGTSPGTAPGESAERPKTFISYMKEDEDAARLLADQLAANGIEPWIDSDGIRGGENWEIALLDAIGEEADFFLVLMSRHLADGVETWVHREIEAALKRMSMRGAVKFIYPVQIHSDALLLDSLARRKLQIWPLHDYHEGVPDLAKDIKREFAKFRRR